MARNLSLKKTYQMGILIPEREQDGGYWDLQAKGIDKAVQDMQMYNVRSSFFYYDKYSEQSFDTACQEVLEKKDKLAGLIIAPVLSKASERFIRIMPEDLPYIFIDSYIPNSQCLSYIGQDSIQSGVLAGKLMSLLVVSKGTIVVMRVLPEDYHITDRIEGFSSVLQNRKDIQIKMIDADRMADHQILYKLAHDLSKVHEDLRGIFIPHACAFQVAESLNGHLQSEGIHIIGYDLVEYNRKYLKDGVIDFIISQRPENQGFHAVSTLYKHVVLRQVVEQKIVIPMDIITRENVNYYQI
jgi:LacI family transcriptional regulator